MASKPKNVGTARLIIMQSYKILFMFCIQSFMDDFFLQKFDYCICFNKMLHVYLFILQIILKRYNTFILIKIFLLWTLRFCSRWKIVWIPQPSDLIQLTESLYKMRTYDKLHTQFETWLKYLHRCKPKGVECI